MDFARNRLVVNALRLLWTVLAVWYEHFIFLHSVRQCVWPDSKLQARKDLFLPRPTHVLVVADPQILDHRSYPGRAPLLTYVSQLLVDLNLRKNWRASLRLQPDVVVFLGDMMDGGRFAMSDSEYEQYYSRFKSIFSLDASIPSYWIPGNHDTGLGTSDQFSRAAEARYISHFGPLNDRVTIANHTVILLDAPSFAEEDGHAPAQGGPSEFVMLYANSKDQDPVVLFTHIPLSRPEGSDCGPYRERGTIRKGAGFGYQNTLGKSASDFLLQNLQPSVIFSGDDHDYCEYTHSYVSGGKTRHVREVTVKSLSMAMGIRQPGIQLLSLVPPDPMHGSLSHSDSLCLLPDQLGIYLSTYIPFLVFSLLVICFANIYKIRTSQYSASLAPSYAPLSSALRSHSDSGRHGDAWLNYPPEDDALPRPAAFKNAPRPLYSWTFVLLSRRRRISISADSMSSLASLLCGCCGGDVPKSRGTARGILYDVRDVAVFPLAIFGVLAWWMFR
ncbi:Metallo-dependent phosphatase-like protein [Mycena pura]|uniref:Metallo-dependent phosphatase-like protein n=1 Tax=Mycena pura TaxID=153505 RepID=A0AAD6VPD0_9AGAR|nr:Metallo-dependent phosphatase-like protein [Mycena pura]